MKILYAVQATGNGHISRAIQLLPLLQQYGQVDVFLSGANSHLSGKTLQPKFTSKGLSLFYTGKGGLDYFKTATAFAPKRLLKEARDLPVEDYDIILNDFECITSLACKLKNIPSIQFGHQASFLSSKVPMPKKFDPVGKFILKNYATSTAAVGLHFQPYDSFIFSPIIKQTILQAQPQQQQHITVYLSHYSDAVIAQQLLQIPDMQFQIFSKAVTQPVQQKNLLFLPINNLSFTTSMINSLGVITGAGFETPAEAMYLGKKLLCLPIQGQYEQLCNAAALQQLQVPIVQQIGAQFHLQVQQWLLHAVPQQLQLQQSTADIVQHTIQLGLQLKQQHTGSALQNPSIDTHWALQP